MDNVSELLLKAADIIARDGHHKGVLYAAPLYSDFASFNEFNDADDKAGRTAPVCAMGALRRAAWGTAKMSHHGDIDPVFLAAANQLRQTVENGQFDGVPRWNDHPGTTSEDVILAMKQAAHDVR